MRLAPIRLSIYLPNECDYFVFSSWFDVTGTCHLIMLTWILCDSVNNTHGLWHFKIIYAFTQTI